MTDKDNKRFKLRFPTGKQGWLDLPVSKIKILDSQTKKIAENLFCDEISTFLLKLANEPDIALYRVQEHVRNKYSKLVGRADRIKRSNERLDLKLDLADYALSNTKHLLGAEAHIQEIQESVHKIRKSGYFERNVDKLAIKDTNVSESITIEAQNSNKEVSETEKEITEERKNNCGKNKICNESKIESSEEAENQEKVENEKIQGKKDSEEITNMEREEEEEENSAKEESNIDSEQNLKVNCDTKDNESKEYEIIKNLENPSIQEEEILEESACKSGNIEKEDVGFSEIDRKKIGVVEDSSEKNLDENIDIGVSEVVKEEKDENIRDGEKEEN